MVRLTERKHFMGDYLNETAQKTGKDRVGNLQELLEPYS